MGFDLTQFESIKYADEGVNFPLVHPLIGPVIGGDGKPVTFRIGHMDSARIRAAVNAKRKKREDDRAAVSTTEPLPDIDRVKDACDDLSTLTIGWSDNFVLGGEPCPFSQEAASSIYYRFPEIMEQMARGAGERANFMLGLAKP